MRNLRSRARAALDQRLANLRPIQRFETPPKGWIRAIRDSLGMTGAQLARRLSVRSQSVADIERSEAAGTISLETLRKAAAAMDCAVVYALVPRTALTEMVRNRAREIALREIGGVAHSMAIEDQSAPDDIEKRIERFIGASLKERDLWEDA